MSLRLEIVSRQRQSLGERGVKEFGQSGGTIGRSLESDWVLPDGQRFLSSRHASIDFRSGSYYIIDTSTNGVFINDSDEPVGRGKPQRLFSGDRVRMGDYELIVEIDEIDSTQETLADSNHVDPVDAKARVEAPDPTGMDLVDPYEITGVGIETLLDEDEADTLSPLGYKFATDELELAPDPGATGSHGAGDTARAKPKVRPRVGASDGHASGAKRARGTSDTSSRRAKQAAGRRGNAAPRPDGAGARSPSMPSQDALGAFFEGAGIEGRQLGDVEARSMLYLLGQLTRELLLGMTQTLQLRSQQKAHARQTNTTIQARDNNALKFCATVDEAFEHLLFRRDDEYLGPLDSVRGAFTDIQAHQRALMQAMRAAVADYLEKLDPDRLEEKFSKGKRGSIMGAASKLKYWDLYRDTYLVLSQSGSSELPQAFVEEFSRVYENEMAHAARAVIAAHAEMARKAG